MTVSRRSFLTLLAASGAAGCSGPSLTDAMLASGSADPNGVTLIVPGGPTSRSGQAGRLTAEALSRQLARPVAVVNTETPQEAYARLAAAEPDGRTVGLVGADVTLFHWRGLSPVKPGALTPIAMLSEDPAGIHVRRDARWTSARELERDIGANPGRLNVSGAGAGSIWHMSSVRWVQSAGHQPNALAWNPAPNPAAAAEALALGGPDIVVCSVPEVRFTPQRGQIRTLAIMSGRRNPRYPDVPSFEAGNQRARAGFWRGVCGPQGMPRSVVARLQGALRRAHGDQVLAVGLHRHGFQRTLIEGDAFAELMAREDRRMAHNLQSVGLISA